MLSSATQGRDVQTIWHAMKTKELLEIEQALRLIDQVLRGGSEEGEHLVLRSAARESGGRSLEQQRLATRKSLSAARNLLTVAVGLMHEPGQPSGKEASIQLGAAIDKLKIAARGAYEAGHLLVGVKRESA